MAWKLISPDVNHDIRYICISSDTKLAGDIGSKCYESDTYKTYINSDGTATGWVEYKSPALYSAI